MNKKYKFDINRHDLYQFDKPELKERTKQRLTEMAELGMHESGNASFGYENIMSGLYIEKIWNYSDEEFNDYMDWVKELINKKTIK